MKKKHKKIFPVSKKMVSMLATALAVSPAVMIHTASAADTSFVVDEGRSLDIDLSTLFPNTGLTFGIQTQTGTHFTTNLSNSGNNKDDTNNIMTVTNISTDSSNNFIDNFEIKGVYSSNQSYVSTIDVRLAMRPVATDGNDEYRYVGQNPDIIIPLSDLFTDQDDAGLNGNVSVTEKVGFDYVTLLTWGSPTSDYAYSTDNVLNFHSGTGTTTKTLKVTYTDNDYSSTNSSIKFKSHSIDKVITLNMNHDPVVNADWANDDNGIGKKTFDVEQGAPVFIPYAGMFTDPDGDVLGYTT
ncbi:MAG: hypothetical protein JWM44_1450, partial [Bacilli bacterium]|nr:hypothetical protein [Bacilli bacterium]